MSVEQDKTLAKLRNAVKARLGHRTVSIAGDGRNI